MTAVELDHLLWAAPDLDEGARLFERLTSVRPAPGGTHPGFGTRNMLAALDGGRYFEIIAPDPAQALRENWGAEIAALPAPAMRGFALGTRDLPGLRRAAEAAGLSVDGPVAMSRARPDGVRLAWSIMPLRSAALGPVIPFAIDWGETAHPSASTPSGCRLSSLVALHPKAAALRAVYAAIGVDVPVHAAARPGFVAVLDTPSGPVTLI